MSQITVEARLYVDGEYVEGAGPERYEVISPVTGTSIGSVPVPVASDIDAAVAAANRAQQNWARVNVWERAKVCHAIGDGITARRDELARLQTLEQGKPLTESLADVDESATLFHLHAEDAVRMTGETRGGARTDGSSQQRNTIAKTSSLRRKSYGRCPTINRRRREVSDDS